MTIYAEPNLVSYMHKQVKKFTTVKLPEILPYTFENLTLIMSNSSKDRLLEP